MLKKSNHNLGVIAEQTVAQVYEKRSFKIIAKNFSVYFGKKFAEIDLIAHKANSVHFIEVKARSSQTYGSGLEVVGFQKKKRIILAAKCFIAANAGYFDCQPHFDIAAVQLRPFDKKIEKITIYSDVIQESC